ncbi:hypothetical protein Mpsy_0514 [Methanolobus psychrophilus R15]|nr:hypothetical protein Mpsy_0514 [Methanolobus psychrophilus R15]
MQVWCSGVRKVCEPEQGLAKRDSLCIRPSSIRTPVPNGPLKITIRIGIAKSRALIRTENNLVYG